MQVPFPELTDLALCSHGTVPALLDSFVGGSAPRLRNLYFRGIPFPGDAPEPEACAYISSGPAGPTLERDHNLPLLKARATDPTSAAIPDDIGHIGAPKSTPGRPQPTRERHTTPLQPPKPLNSLQEPQFRSFRFSFASDTSSSSDHTPIKSHCDPNAFPMFPTSADPQQSDARWSRTGRSEIGAQQKEVVCMTRF